MMQSITAPRGRAITASTPVDILAVYGAPVQFLQNNGATDANVKFNGGASFVIKAAETIRFNVPVHGTIESDQDLVALA